MANSKQDLSLLPLAHELILQTMEPGVLVLDGNMVVVKENPSVSRICGLTETLVGKSLDDSILERECPFLRKNLQESLERNTPVIQFKYKNRFEVMVQVTIKPVWGGDDGSRIGTLIYMATLGSHESLQSVNDELRTTKEALHATNDELAAVNEELQLTNEELEATNEELQSTNEELQTVNEELETTNDELSERADLVEEMSLRYQAVLERIPWPVFILSDELTVDWWSKEAQRMFSLIHEDGRDLRLFELPFPTELRQVLSRRHDTVMRTNKPTIVRNQFIHRDGMSGMYDIRMEPVAASGTHAGVLLVFEKVRDMVRAPKTNSHHAVSVSTARLKKK